jgi:hypothetical protein
MYFNTVATNRMAEKINNLFNPDNIGYWKANVRGQFAPLSQGGKVFPLIAGSNNVYPDEGPTSGMAARWIAWLGEVERGVGNRFRAIFYAALNPADKCDEMIFLVQPTSSGSISVDHDRVLIPGGQGRFSEVVTIKTPTVDAILKARRKRRVARKKATAKKKR